MISGNQTWQSVLQSGAKQPLYVFEIPDLNLIITSFSPSVIPLVQGGYGVILYGVGAWGT